MLAVKSAEFDGEGGRTHSFAGEIAGCCRWFDRDDLRDAFGIRGNIETRAEANLDDLSCELGCRSFAVASHRPVIKELVGHSGQDVLVPWVVHEAIVPIRVEACPHRVQMIDLFAEAVAPVASVTVRMNR